jgi:hypothetical protein
VTEDIKAYDETIKTMNQSFDRLPENPKNKKWVKKKLKHMFDVDQYMRNYWNDQPFKQKYSEDEKAEFQKFFLSRFQAMDARNTNELKRLLKIYPWFKISEFGKVTDKQAWILVQHADMDPEFQKSVLAILTKLVPLRETDLSNYAYLVDRVASSFGDPSQAKPQKYGTQGVCRGVGQWEPHPVEDPENLDKRRKEMGLGTESEYKKMFKDICH